MKPFIETLKNGKLDLVPLFEDLEYLRSITWEFETWKTSPALIDKSGGTLRQYNGGKFDEKYFIILDKGWTHDHCEICSEKITNDVKAYQSKDNDWLCESCYIFFIKPDNIDDVKKSIGNV
jgi:hypothetical protein